MSTMVKSGFSLVYKNRKGALLCAGLIVLAAAGMCLSGGLFGTAQAAEPQPVGTSGEKTETITYPFYRVVKYADETLSREGRVDAPTQYLEQQGIKDVRVASDYTCTVEVPAGTWDNLKAAMVTFTNDAIASYEAHYQDWSGGSPVDMTATALAFEADEEFASVSISVEKTAGGYNVVNHAVNRARAYRTFADLDPMMHLTITDGGGATLYDADIDGANSQWWHDIRGLFA